MTTPTPTLSARLTTREALDASTTPQEAVQRLLGTLGSRGKVYRWALLQARSSAANAVLAAWWGDVAALTAPGKPGFRPVRMYEVVDPAPPFDARTVVTTQRAVREWCGVTLAEGELVEVWKVLPQGRFLVYTLQRVDGKLQRVDV